MLSLRDLEANATIKVEQSTLASGMYIARAAIGMSRGDRRSTMFGFGASLDKSAAVSSARFELYERLCFTANSYSSAELRLKGIAEGPLLDWPADRTSIEHLMCGAPSSAGVFSGNGTAVHTDKRHCISHAKRELLERHLCASFWYAQTFRPKRLPLPSWIDGVARADISIYAMAVAEINAVFVMSFVSNEEDAFFAMGAALRPKFHAAVEHAFGETAMLFHDFVCERYGPDVPTQSQLNVIKLRDASSNRTRHAYLKALMRGPEPTRLTDVSDQLSPEFSMNIVTFQPQYDMFAARAFSVSAMDPVELAKQLRVPTLPLS
ncbi:YcaO-like family protein [Candidatus Burkholderia verschuerenii]|uniref:YcaO-like family protein n=1 Tax=Candidatus Burkholderia verschuerenii TaxID=242163 RepID=UPI00067C357A|nr:YcaO-like family protein [Candidatus Burkholderia verschuerenii]